ncbi:MAG: uracil-DNA glycosylase [Hyphomicrobiaceae bacterium]|nr:uracil-DNA glycosylase [Hyphomicrobiaceae bacterium]
MIELTSAIEPEHNCKLCPRLAAFRQENRSSSPTWYNAPVPSFGSPDARVLIVGLAPGLKGANRTGRPFTGDYAGDLLYKTLLETGFACGRYDARSDDDLALIDCRITNAVRCVPPQNKPTPAEIISCRGFLASTLSAMPRLLSILALGRIAHDSVLSVLRARKAAFAFRHGAVHEPAPGLRVYDSYHCSRYNTNTGVLTPDMFRAVMTAVRAGLD